jgi:hypothetical protein
MWERMNFLKLIEYSPKPVANFIVSSETLKYSFPGLGMDSSDRALPSMCTALVQLLTLQKNFHIRIKTVMPITTSTEHCTGSADQYKTRLKNKNCKGRNTNAFTASTSGSCL